MSNILRERPVMSGSTLTALLSAIYGICAAFNVHDFTEAQQTAIAALIAAVALITGKAAASNVYVPSTVGPMVAAAAETGKAEAEAEAAERIAAAEAFGVPDQNQMPLPVRPSAFNVGPQPPAPPR